MIWCVTLYSQLFSFVYSCTTFFRCCWQSVMNNVNTVPCMSTYIISLLRFLEILLYTMYRSSLIPNKLFPMHRNIHNSRSVNASTIIQCTILIIMPNLPLYFVPFNQSYSFIHWKHTTFPFWYPYWQRFCISTSSTAVPLASHSVIFRHQRHAACFHYPCPHSTFKRLSIQNWFFKEYNQD